MVRVLSTKLLIHQKKGIKNHKIQVVFQIQILYFLSVDLNKMADDHSKGQTNSQMMMRQFSNKPNSSSCRKNFKNGSGWRNSQNYLFRDFFSLSICRLVSCWPTSRFFNNSLCLLISLHNSSFSSLTSSILLLAS